MLADRFLEYLEPRKLLALIPIGSEFRVNTFTTGSQTGSSVAIDADGDFAIVWSSAGQDGSGYGVYARRYNAAGVPQGGEFRVNQYTTSDQAVFSMGMDAFGNFVVAWQSLGQDGSGYGVWARRFDAAGNPLGDEFQVNTFTTNDQGGPRVAMNATGEFVIAWGSQVGSSPTGTYVDVYARQYDSSGMPQGGEFVVNTYTTGLQYSPTVAIDRDGDFVVAWLSSQQDATIYSIYAQRFNAAGVAQGSEFRVHEHTSGLQASPHIAYQPDGKFVIAWHDDNQDGSALGIYARRFDATGAPSETEFRVNGNTTGDQRLPRIATNPDGSFMVMWSSDHVPGAIDDVYVREFNATGTPIGDEFRVNTYTTGSQFGSSVFIGRRGELIVSWTSILQDGSNRGIYAQRYAVIPAVVASSFIYQTAPQRLAFQFNQDVSGSLTLDDILVQDLTHNMPITPAGLTYDAVTNTATIPFSGILPDANFRATLFATGITSASGIPMAGDVVFDFFFLNGDANRDGRVTLPDFNILAANFGLQNGATFSMGDFNYDGRVTLPDFNILAGRFGMVLSSNPGTSLIPQSLFGQQSIEDHDLLGRMLA